jgi:hypothetical protein
VGDGFTLTPTVRGTYLTALGLKAEKRIWVTGGKQANGYSLAAIEQAADRWLPTEQSETDEGFAMAA